MLDAGMGRAILYILKRGVSEYRDLVLDSCLHNRAYDRYLEGSRAEYLYPLMEASGEEGHYRTQILRALPETSDACDLGQLFDLAGFFARRGDEEARSTMRKRLSRGDIDSVEAGDDAIIALGGADGLVFFLDVVGRHQELMDRYDHFCIIEDAERVSGVEAVRVALANAAAENPNVAAALANIKDYSPDWTPEEIICRREESRAKMVRPPYIESLSEATTWQEVKSSPYFERIVFSWSRLASAEELEKAARDLDPAAETMRLRSHLRVFWWNAFPLDPKPLIDLVDHQDERVVIPALSALELVQDENVRKLFERLLGVPQWSHRAIGLLRSNYRSGDDRLIVELLDQEPDTERLHSMCVDTMHVYRDNPSEEGLQPLLAVYENGPCSTCRRRCAETINSIAALPDWMIEECEYDAYSCTREFAAQLKQSKP